MRSTTFDRTHSVKSKIWKDFLLQYFVGKSTSCKNCKLLLLLLLKCQPFKLMASLFLLKVHVRHTVLTFMSSQKWCVLANSSFSGCWQNGTAYCGDPHLNLNLFFRALSIFPCVTKFHQNKIFNHIYDNNFRINHQYLLLSKHSLPTLYIKVPYTSLLIRLSVYPTQASLLGLLITFVNDFHFNLVILLVYFEIQSLVINLITCFIIQPLTALTITTREMLSAIYQNSSQDANGLITFSIVLLVLVLQDGRDAMSRRQNVTLIE